MTVHPVPLGPDDIYFFYSLTEEIRDPRLLERYRSMIGDAEKARIARYRFEKDRHTSLIARALVRFALSSGSGQPPETFQFTENAYGKPDLKPGCASMPIRFNLSHSHGMVACAIARDREIGVDVEYRRGDIDLDLADRFFSPPEADYIRSRPAERRPSAFFDLWTLKEAYIKARGMGLSIDLGHFGFTLDPHIRIHMEDSLQDAPDRWAFFRFAPEPDYHAAIAVRGDAREMLNLRVRRCIPFLDL